MEPESSERSIEAVIEYLVGAGFDVHRSSGQARTTLGVVGEVSNHLVAVVRELEGVAKVVRVSEPYRLASRRFRRTPTVIEGAWGTIGAERPWIAVEPMGLHSRPSSTADEPAPASTELPYQVAAGRPFDAAVTRTRIAPDAVGSLACLSLHPQPADNKNSVLFVERAPSWGAEAWIVAADKELQRAQMPVALLEAGIEYPNGARTLEIAAIARAKLRTHLPVVVDVPTIAQRAKYCKSVACAAIGAGADGVILRAWVGPEEEPPRYPATLSYHDAVALAEKLRAIRAAMRE